MHCSYHQLDYEKKNIRITWLRCRICGNVYGWLEDNRPIIEGKAARLSYSEKRTLRYINQPEANVTHHTTEFINGGYHGDFKASAALFNATELVRARTDKSSPIDNMPILGYNDTSPFDNMSISPPETHDNMSNLPSLKQQH
jgi:hypothetical protein